MLERARASSPTTRCSTTRVTLDVGLSLARPGHRELRDRDCSRTSATRRSALREFAPGRDLLRRRPPGQGRRRRPRQQGRGGPHVGVLPACGFSVDVTEERDAGVLPALRQPGDRRRQPALRRRRADARVVLDDAPRRGRRSTTRATSGSGSASSRSSSPTSTRQSVTSQWYVEDYGFGAKHMRDLDAAVAEPRPRGRARRDPVHRGATRSTPSCSASAPSAGSSTARRQQLASTSTGRGARCGRRRRGHARRSRSAAACGPRACCCGCRR